MKKVSLPLSRLSFAQKLDLMEELWTDLAKDEIKLESPAWHGALLKERGAAYAAGKLKTAGWEEAKKRIIDIVAPTFRHSRSASERESSLRFT